MRMCVLVGMPRIQTGMQAHSLDWHACRSTALTTVASTLRNKSLLYGNVILRPLQALRPFRLLVIFRMIRRAKGIRLMVSTLLMSLPALFNVACLLGLAFLEMCVMPVHMAGKKLWCSARGRKVFRAFS